MNNIDEILQNVLYLILVGIVPLLVKYAVTFLQVKIAENSAKIDNDKLEQYLFAATDALEKVVLSINQTYVDTLKLQGAFTEDAKTTAKNMAIKKAKELLTEESKKAIELLYGDLTEYLDISIEALVRKNKLEK